MVAATEVIEQVIGDTPARNAWRQAVGEAARKGKEKLGADSHSRIDLAVQIVLRGDVDLQEEGCAMVGSESDATKSYPVNGACPCPDAHRAPQGLCKHRLAVYVMRRAQTLLPAYLAHLDEALAETVQSSQVPARFLVELHGKQFVTYGGLLTLAHERGLTSLTARFISVTADLALAEATATFADGRTFSEAADATPGNVGAMVRSHFPRMALTRAKARVLRDALNVALVAIEELEN